MKLQNVGISSLVSLICYIGLSFFLGPYGIDPFDTLLNYRDQLIENVKQLENRQEQLLNQKDWLEHDPNSQDELLYGIGLLIESESRIRVEGYDLDPLYQSPGSVLSLQKNHDPPHIMILSLSLAVFIIVLLLTTILSKGEQNWTFKGKIAKIHDVDSFRTIAAHSSRVQTASRE